MADLVFSNAFIFELLKHEEIFIILCAYIRYFCIDTSVSEHHCEGE